jgi:serine/threonine-protein kinase
MAGDSLYAAPFDVERLEIKQGAAVSLSPELGRVAATAGDFDVADNGTLVYVPEGGSAVPERTLAWVNRQGKEEPIPVPPRAYLYPRISPDGTRVALDVREQQNDIWVWDLLRKNLTRVTKDPRVDRTPVWTADGQHLIFSSGRDGPHGLYRQRADGDGVAERLTVPRDAAHFAISVSPNGMQLVLHEGGIAATGDLMTLHLDRVAPARAGSLSSDQRREPTVQDVQPLVKTSHGETNGTISPDGRWFAYQSNESGNWEIYVRPFADGNGGGRSTVSTDGGTQPHWAPDARELFYLSSRNEMMSVRVGGSRSWSAGTPEKLFDTGPYFLGTAGWFLTMYDLSKDGRFLMVKPANGTPATMAAGGNLVVVQNWTEELKRLVPIK